MWKESEWDLLIKQYGGGSGWGAVRETPSKVILGVWPECLEGWSWDLLRWEHSRRAGFAARSGGQFRRSQRPVRHLHAH